MVVLKLVGVLLIGMLVGGTLGMFIKQAFAAAVGMQYAVEGRDAKLVFGHPKLRRRFDKWESSLVLLTWLSSVISSVSYWFNPNFSRWTIGIAALLLLALFFVGVSRQSRRPQSWDDADDAKVNELAEACAN